MDNIVVNTSGAVISSLQYELINSRFDKEGFLLGFIEEQSTYSTSDSEANVLQKSIAISINGYIPCSSYGRFYSGSGRVQDDHLRQCLNGKENSVVGWYHCRSFSQMTFLREFHIHQQLKTAIKNAGENLLFAIFSQGSTGLHGTLNATFKFQVMTSSSEFDAVPVRIVNAKDTSLSQYAMDTPDAFYNSSQRVEKIIHGIKNTEPGVKEAQMFHLDLVQQLKDLLPKYSKIQSEHQKILQKFVSYRQLSYSSGIIPKFEALTEEAREKEGKVAKNEGKSEISRTKGANTKSKGKKGARIKKARTLSSTKNRNNEVIVNTKSSKNGNINVEAERIEKIKVEVSPSKRENESSQDFTNEDSRPEEEIPNLENSKSVVVSSSSPRISSRRVGSSSNSPVVRSSKKVNGPNSPIRLLSKSSNGRIQPSLPKSKVLEDSPEY